MSSWLLGAGKINLHKLALHFLGGKQHTTLIWWILSEKNAQQIEQIESSKHQTHNNCDPKLWDPSLQSDLNEPPPAVPANSGAMINPAEPGFPQHEGMEEKQFVFF